MNTARLSDHRISIPHHAITWLLIALLLILRIALAGILSALSPRVWIYPVYELGTYFLTAMLIWWERDNLANFHIDRLVIILLVLGKPYQLLMDRLQLSFQYQLGNIYWLYLPIAFGLLIIAIFVYPKLRNIQSRDWLWLAAGIVAGSVAGIPAGYLIRQQFPAQTMGLSLSVLLLLPLQQLVAAGIVEEPLFRGYLWGGLRRAGWKEGWILVFQTILFMIAHAYYLGQFPLSFWFVVPLGGLATGVLAWRSRSIAVSMAAHGCFNAVAQIVAFYRF